MIPSYGGGRFPMSTHLAARVRADAGRSRRRGRACRARVAIGFELQAERSVIPGPEDVLIETFPRQGRHYMVVYPFEGRLAHQTLGMLLTRRLDRAGLEPLGFVANDYALSIWCTGRYVGGDCERPRQPRAAVRTGHARRRSRRVAGRKQPDEADVPPGCRHRRADRAPPSRQGQVRPAGHDVDRSDLRRAAPPRSRPHPARSRLGGRGNGIARHRAARRISRPHPRPNQASSVDTRFAVQRADAVGDRPRAGLRPSAGCDFARCRAAS